MLFLFTCLLTLLTPLYWIYKPPNLLIRYFQYHWPDVLWHVPVSEKIVALTIDDGPSAYTEEILQVLKENDATATFFVIGSHVSGRESTLQDLVRAGNELGTHAMRDEPSRSLPVPTLSEQIQSVEDDILKIYASVGGKVPPKYFRPGSGFFSDRMRSRLKALGYRLVLGSIYPHDPQIPYAGVNARHVLSMLRPGGIIICHDGREWTVPMLREVLPEMRKRGYRVVKLTSLLKEGEKEDAVKIEKDG